MARDLKVNGQARAQPQLGGLTSYSTTRPLLPAATSDAEFLKPSDRRTLQIVATFSLPLLLERPKKSNGHIEPVLLPRTGAQGRA